MTADEQTTGPVWRDRGTIIANQQARIAELEAACQGLRDDYQGALADAAGLRARMLRLAKGATSGYLTAHSVFAALAAEPTPAAEPHAEDGAWAGPCTCGAWESGHCDCRPAPVADPDGTKDGQR